MAATDTRLGTRFQGYRLAAAAGPDRFLPSPRDGGWAGGAEHRLDSCVRMGDPRSSAPPSEASVPTLTQAVQCPLRISRSTPPPTMALR